MKAFIHFNRNKDSKFTDLWDLLSRAEQKSGGKIFENIVIMPTGRIDINYVKVKGANLYSIVLPFPAFCQQTDIELEISITELLLKEKNRIEKKELHPSELFEILKTIYPTNDVVISKAISEAFGVFHRYIEETIELKKKAPDALFNDTPKSLYMNTDAKSIALSCSGIVPVMLKYQKEINERINKVTSNTLAKNVKIRQLLGMLSEEMLVRIEDIKLEGTRISFTSTSKVNEQIFKFLNHTKIDIKLPNIDEVVFTSDGIVSWMDKVDTGTLALELPYPEALEMTDWELQLHAEYYRLWVFHSSKTNAEDLPAVVTNEVLKYYTPEQKKFLEVRICFGSECKKSFEQTILELHSRQTASQIRQFFSSLQIELKKPVTHTQLTSLVTDDPKLSIFLGKEIKLNSNLLFEIAQKSFSQNNILKTSGLFKMVQDRFESQYLNNLNNFINLKTKIKNAG